MSIPFSPRAAFCTAVVFVGFGLLAGWHFRSGLFGLRGMDRDGMLPMAGGGALPDEDERSILGEVLRYEARRPGREHACLRIADEGTAFEHEKRRIREMERALRARPALRSLLVPQIEQLRGPRRPWRAPSGLGLETLPLHEEGVRQLWATEAAMLTARKAGDVEINLNLRELPEQFQSERPRCQPLSFTAPAVAGPLAFVETRFDCGPGCSEDWVYAVARREDGWELEAVAPE
jgi:hypothetical protein